MTDICGICCENFRGTDDELYPYLLPCTHIFHIKCIKDCSIACGHKCPVCRREYTNMIDEATKHHRLAILIEKSQGIKEEEEFMIFVKDMTSKNYKLNVCHDFTEAKLFQLVAALCGISNGEFRLCTGTKNLDSEGKRMLCDLKIGPLSTVNILLRLRGGS